MAQMSKMKNEHDLFHDNAILVLCFNIFFLIKFFLTAPTRLEWGPL